MSEEFYLYNGKTYQHEDNEKQFKDLQSSKKRIIILAVTVALLAIIYISISIYINNRANDNLNISDAYNQSSSAHGNIFLPPETTVSGETGSETTPSTTVGNNNFIPTIGRPNKLTLIADDSELITGIDSRYAIIVDRKTGKVIASKGSNERMFPASMTKVMTAIVAYEYMIDKNIDIWNTYVEMTQEIGDYIYKEDAANAGFKPGEKVRIIDALYGVIVPSGADAVLMLAEFCYGSEEDFVDMMNLKAKELGLDETNFETSTGLHHKNHYTTVSEMAIITDYACKYEILKTMLATSTYTFGETNKSNERSLSSTMYSWRRNYSSDITKSEIPGSSMIGGKCGYTLEARYCLTTFVDMPNGDSYIVVTGNASHKSKPISDYVKIYTKYTKSNRIAFAPMYDTLSLKRKEER